MFSVGFFIAYLYECIYASDCEVQYWVFSPGFRFYRLVPLVGRLFFNSIDFLFVVDKMRFLENAKNHLKLFFNTSWR